jgi:hypothetical protein
MWYQVAYTDKRGAGCVRSFSSVETLDAFVSKLRREAKIYAITETERREVGEVVDSRTHPYIGASYPDKRRRWFWYYDTMETR